MPPGWSASSFGAPKPVPRTRSPPRAGANARPQSTADLTVELGRMRRSLEEVCKERDMLKSHVMTLRSQAVSRAKGAPPRPASAPTSRGRRAGSPPNGRKRLTAEDEQEMMRRLYGKTWRPSADAKGTGAEQLKRRLQAIERKAYLASKPTVKVYKTRAELEAQATEMFKEVQRRKAAKDAMIKSKQAAQVPPPPALLAPAPPQRQSAACGALSYRPLRSHPHLTSFLPPPHLLFGAGSGARISEESPVEERDGRGASLPYAPAFAPACAKPAQPALTPPRPIPRPAPRQSASRLQHSGAKAPMKLTPRKDRERRPWVPSATGTRPGDSRSARY